MTHRQIEAHKLVKEAVADGRLVRGTCRCGSADALAHHWDYSKPLDVEWYCDRCHRFVHHHARRAGHDFRADDGRGQKYLTTVLQWSPPDLARVRAAAKATGTNLSKFIRGAALARVDAVKGQTCVGNKWAFLHKPKSKVLRPSATHGIQWTPADLERVGAAAKAFGEFRSGFIRAATMAETVRVEATLPTMAGGKGDDHVQ